MAKFVLSGGFWQADAYLTPLSRTLRVYIMDETGASPTERQLRAYERFQTLPTTLCDEIARHAIRYCDRIDDLVGLEAEGIAINRSQIGQHFRITTLLIPRLADSGTDYYFISADCDWEPEHGMQIILENDAIVYCSDHSSLAFGAAWQKVLDEPDETRAQILRDALQTL